MNAQGKNVINLGIGSPDISPSPQTIKALEHSANQDGHHGYQPYQGIQPLRKAMANWYKQTYQVDLDPNSEVLPLIGSKEGIFHISMAFLNPGDQVLVPNPGYPGYAGATRLLEADPIFYDLKENHNWKPDWNELDKIDTTKVKIMWINYPHMPTGAVANNDDFSRLVKFASERNILLCNDNPYSLILNPDKPLSLLSSSGAKANCLELNSLSKSHNMAGWRIGMVLGRSDYINTILKVKSNIDSGMFRAIQDAAITALDNRRQWHAEQNNIYRQRRRLTHRLMDQLGCRYDPETPGLFVWAKLPDLESSAESLVDNLLYKANVFITPGIIFGDQGARYLRASLCVPEEKIKEAIERIEKHLITAS